MKIDSRIEELVREALDAAVKQDWIRLDAALKAFSDDASRRAAVELLVAICAVAAVDLHSGERPTDEDLEVLATQVAEAEEWSHLERPEVHAFLRRVFGDESAEFDPDAGVIMVFVVTASLLAASPTPEDVHWYHYLDRVEATIEQEL